jgi:hypothetical protein
VDEEALSDELSDPHRHSSTLLIDMGCRWWLISS